MISLLCTTETMPPINTSVMPLELLQEQEQYNNNSNQSLRNSHKEETNHNQSENNSNRLSTTSLASTIEALHNDNIYTLSNEINSTPDLQPPTTPVIRMQDQDRTDRGKANDETDLKKIQQNEKPAAPTPPADIIGSVLGDFGLWQLRSVLILFLCKIPASWFMACIIYTAPELQPTTQYSCDRNDLGRNETISPNECYVVDWSANVAPDGSAQGEILSLEPCTDFIYNDDDFYSLVMQFNLVCLREIYVAWTQYWHLFGVLVGGVIGTKAMLTLSPRTVYIIGAVLQIGMGVITGYAPGLSLHIVFRCLSAVCCAMMFTSAQAIFLDITGGRYRTGVVILYETFWSIGVILLPGLSSYFKSWSHIYLGITFPTIILLLLLRWTPESPRWLLKNGNEDDVYRVECIIRKAVDINERTFLIPDDFRQQLEKLRESLRSQKPPAPWVQLWRGPRAIRYMLAAHIVSACYIVNFMGMLLNIRSFGRDYRVPNTIIMGIVEIIGIFIALHFAMKHSQKRFIYAGIFNIFAGFIGCLGWTFTGIDLHPNLKVMLWMLIAIIPKISVSCGLAMTSACLTDLMPANKKQPFMFSVVTWARICLLTAPFINVLKSVDVALPLTFFSLLSVIAGVCTCLLQPPNQNNKANLSISRTDDNEESNKKELSPLNNAIWTVQGDIYNTRL